MQVIKNIEPQPGFQWSVMESPADVVILGGSAGCGKTWLLLFEALRHLDVNGYNAMIFRREDVQITSTGGLWDKAIELYTGLPFPYNPVIKQRPASFRFPQNSSVHFGHLNQMMDVLKYQGAEIAYIGFDELTHFEEYQFFYMLSRNRSTCGVRPIIRASTNPQGEGWVKNLISWWLYPDDYPDETLSGFPIKERAGVLRYFIRYDGEILWGDTKQEAWEQLPESERSKLPMQEVKSMTFIGGKLAENPALTTKDPGYIAGLFAQSEADRVQLLDGRWIDPSIDQRRLFDDAEISDLFTNSFVEDDTIPGAANRYMTADVALEGADRFTIGIWQGWVLIKYYEFEQTRPEDVHPLMVRIAKENRVPQSNIAFDATGVGAMLKGYLRAARAVIGAASPLENREETGRGDIGKRSQYLNLRAQLFYKTKEVLSERRAYCAVKDIDLQRTLTAELKVVKKAPTKADLKLRIVPKEEMKLALKGRSPDVADMFVIRAIFELKPSRRTGHVRKAR